MHKIKSLIPQSIKNIYHLIQAILANVWYGFPSRNIRIIGVTGTNGKTTTVQMIAKILEEADKKIAVASTINFKIADKEWVNKTKFTTLSSFAVQKFIKQAVKAGCEYVVLETSSHSLDQYRVWGVEYKTAVITNVTREHLDYHKTMETYQKAKKKLFEIVAKNKGVIIVNLDMEKPEEFLMFDAGKKYGYTIESQKSKVKSQKSEMEIIKAENVKLRENGSSYEIQNTRYEIHLPGEFNVENALAATCVGMAENISLEIISKALEKIKNVPGRFEFVPNNKGLNIIVDYAVTPDSLEKLYELIEKIKKAEPSTEGSAFGNIIAVFGSCGERDRGKRPIMGEIVSLSANYIIVTNEDPYDEDPQKIINEVFKGVIEESNGSDSDIVGSSNFQLPITNFQTNNNDQFSNDKNIRNTKVEGINCWRILDRREAIRKALELAKSGDFVVVTGKGAEETMAIGKEIIPWNDKNVIKEELEKL